MKINNYFFILLLLCILFFKCDIVNAVSVNCENSYSYKNTCNSSIKSVNSGCGGEIGFSDSNSPSTKTGICSNPSSSGGDTTTIKRTYNKFKIYIAIDDSHSMKTTDPDYKRTMNALYKVVEDLTTKIKGNSASIKIQINYFSSSESGNWKDLKNTSEIQQVNKTIGNMTKYMKTKINGTNTYFSRVIKVAKSAFSDGDYIPIVIFVTDGYPTVDGKENLGYLSSTRYFVSALDNLKKLKDHITGINGKAKIYTVSVGLDKNDRMAKFLLSPKKDNYDNLKSNSIYEEHNLKSVLDGGSSYEAVLGIASHPETGLYSPTNIYVNKNKTTHHIVFTFGSSGTRFNKKLLKENGIMFAGLQQHNDGKCGEVKMEYYYNKKYYKLSSVKTISHYGEDDKYCYYGFNVSSTEASRIYSSSRVRVSFEANSKQANNKYFRIRKYSHSPKLSKGSFYGIVDSYISVDKADDLVSRLPSLISSIKVYEDSDDSTDSSTNTATFKYKEVVHDSCASPTITIANGFTYNGEKKAVNVPVVITESSSFSPGDLSDISVNAGRGFSIGSPYVENKVMWYYQYFKDGNKKIPMVQVNGKLVSLNELGYNGGKCDINCLDGLVWKQISESYLNDVSGNIENSFKTVDSNDASMNDSIMSLEVKMNDSGGIIGNADSNIKNVFSRRYDIFQQKACVSAVDGYVFYGDEVCENGDTSLKVVGNKYFIPIDQAKGTVNVNINENFSSVDAIKYQFNNTCPINVTSDTIKVNPNNYYFRTIDVGDPFPKAGDNYNKIPVNWRDWYCSSNGGGICNVNKGNANRLKSSYNNLVYKIKLDSDTIYSINKDTNLDGGYNSNFSNEDFPEFTGVSNFVNHYFCGVNTCENASSYCSIGEFNDSCDKWGGVK